MGTTCWLNAVLVIVTNTVAVLQTVEDFDKEVIGGRSEMTGLLLEAELLNVVDRLWGELSEMLLEALTVGTPIVSRGELIERLVTLFETETELLNVVERLGKGRGELIEMLVTLFEIETELLSVVERLGRI